MRSLTTLPVTRAYGYSSFTARSPVRSFHISRATLQAQSATSPSAHSNFYKSHGRALAKTLTLAFFSYQCFYWAWITLETEAEKDGKNREVKSLEKEVNLLQEGKNSHLSNAGNGTHDVDIAGKRLLEENSKP